MRILRSQYLNYHAQQGPQSLTRQTTASELNVAADGVFVRQTRSQTIRMRLAAAQAYDKNNNHHSSNNCHNIEINNYTETHSDGIINSKNNSYTKSRSSNNTGSCRANLNVSFADQTLNTLKQSACATVGHDLLLTAQAPASISNSTTTTSTICCTIKPKTYAADDSNSSLTGTTSGGDIIKRRQTVDCGQQLKINLYNVPTDNYSRINLVVRFYDEGPLWYTRFYRGYQDVLWVKLPRNEKSRSKKWFYECRVCKRLLCSFRTLKFHLNIHMRFYPYQCDMCIKSYASKQTLQSHIRKKHRKAR